MAESTLDAVLPRLAQWLTPFASCFGRRGHMHGLDRYVAGLLSDSPRKSMQAMLTRVAHPGEYQALQHFITHARWDARRVWTQLLAQIPDRRGVLVLDDTGLPKQGRHSVGVGRQYSGTLGKIGNCQVTVTAALWTGARAWLVGAELYLPQTWLSAAARRAARIPAHVPFQEKWRMALTLVRRVRAAGFQLALVVADAGYGDVHAFRTALDRWRLAYAVGISSTVTVFPGTPRVVPTPPRPRGGRPRTRALLARGVHTISVAAWAADQATHRWRRVQWRNGSHRAWQALFIAVRVTPAVAWRRGERPREVWLICQRPVGAIGATPHDRYYLSNLPAETSLRALVRATHQRWAIEQQYQHLKTELGLDHFEGRSYPGWQHHAVISAVAYAFLQTERRLRRDRRRHLTSATPTFPVIAGHVQDVFTALLFVTQPRYLRLMEHAQRFVQLRM